MESGLRDDGSRKVAGRHRRESGFAPAPSGKMVTSTPRDMMRWSGARPVGAKPSSGSRFSSHAPPPPRGTADTAHAKPRRAADRPARWNRAGSVRRGRTPASPAWAGPKVLTRGVFKQASRAIRPRAGPQRFVADATLRRAARFHLRVLVGQMEKAACDFHREPLIRIQRIEPHARVLPRDHARRCANSSP